MTEIAVAGPRNRDFDDFGQTITGGWARQAR
jgi:hypothetical protein